MATVDFSSILGPSKVTMVLKEISGCVQEAKMSVHAPTHVKTQALSQPVHKSMQSHDESRRFMRPQQPFGMAVGSSMSYMQMQPPPPPPPPRVQVIEQQPPPPPHRVQVIEHQVNEQPIMHLPQHLPQQIQLQPPPPSVFKTVDA